MGLENKDNRSVKKRIETNVSLCYFGLLRYKVSWVFPRKPLGTGAKNRTQSVQAGRTKFVQVTRTKFVPLKNTAGDPHGNRAGGQAAAQPNLLI